MTTLVELEVSALRLSIMTQFFIIMRYYWVTYLKDIGRLFVPSWSTHGALHSSQSNKYPLYMTPFTVDVVKINTPPKTTLRTPTEQVHTNYVPPPLTSSFHDDVRIIHP